MISGTEKNLFIETKFPRTKAHPWTIEHTLSPPFTCKNFCIIRRMVESHSLCHHKSIELAETPNTFAQENKGAMFHASQEDAWMSYGGLKYEWYMEIKYNELKLLLVDIIWPYLSNLPLRIPYFNSRAQIWHQKTWKPLLICEIKTIEMEERFSFKLGVTLKLRFLLGIWKTIKQKIIGGLS